MHTPNVAPSALHSLDQPNKERRNFFTSYVTQFRHNAACKRRCACTGFNELTQKTDHDSHPALCRYF